MNTAVYNACIKDTMELLAKARIAVLRDGPYYGHLLYMLMPVMAPGLGTLAVSNEMHLFVDPVRCATDPELSQISSKTHLPEKLAGTLVHEMHHILRGLERIEALAKINPEMANIAADLTINFDLRRAGWQLPNWVVYPEKYGFPEELSMEDYFALLMKDPEKYSQQTRELVAAAKGSKEPADGDDQGQGQGKGGLDIGAGMCGEVGGNSPDIPQSAKDETPGREPVEIENAKAKVAKEAKDFAESTGRGIGGGWAEEAVKRVKKKDRDWVRELHQLVRHQSGVIMAGGSDFSLRRPSKRSLSRGILRPGLVEQQYEVAICIDTSGSMGQEQLAYAKNTVCNVIEQTGVDTVWLAQCDYSIQQPYQRTRLRDIDNMPMKGRGGTSFIPIFDELKKLKPRPDLLMVLTDGDGPAPDLPPRGVVVVWVIVPSGWRRTPADWGHVIICSNDPDILGEYKAPRKRSAKRA